MPTPTPPLRGRRGRDRRIAERVASDFASRHTGPTREALDFDVAEVDREVEDEARRATPRASEPVRPAGAIKTVRPAVQEKVSAHRLPDLSSLPPLLVATGTFAAL